jgi:hypothetical protein
MKDWLSMAHPRRAPKENRNETLDGDGLPQTILHAGVSAEFAILDRIVGREGNDPGPSAGRSAPGHPTRCLQSVHLGHMDVHEHDVVIVPADGREDFETIPGDIDIKPEPLQQDLIREPDRLVVLGKQDS